MDIIQVTNPKFRAQTMRSIIVANARHQLQLAGQVRTLDYHRHAFLAKSDRERKALASQLAEMTTIMEVEWIRPPAATFPAAPSWRSSGFARPRLPSQRHHHGGEPGEGGGRAEGEGASSGDHIRAQRTEHRQVGGRRERRSTSERQYCICARTHVYKYAVLHQRRCKDPACKYSRVQVLSTASETLQGPSLQVLTCTSTQYCIRDAARTHLARTHVYKYAVLHLRKDPRVQVRSTASVQGPTFTSIRSTTSVQGPMFTSKYAVLHQRRCKDPSCKYSRVQVRSTASETLQGPIVQVLTCTSTQYCIRDAARTHRASANVYKYSVLHQRRCKDPSCKYSRVQVLSTASETLQGTIVQVLTCTSTQYCIRDAARTHRASANVYKYTVLHLCTRTPFR